MPFLRQEGDVGLGETLGNLGSALGQAFNPLNQFRAYDMLSQIQQRNFELQHARALDAANQNAAIVYHNANPYNLNPADLEVETAKIRNGNPTLTSQTIEGLKAAGTWQANQTAADLFRTNHPDWSPDELSSGVAQILGGKSADDVVSAREQARATTNQTETGLAGTAAARTAATSTNPNAQANAALAAEAAARGNTADAAKIIAQSNVFNTGNIGGDMSNPATQSAVNDLITNQAIAGTTPAAGRAPTVALQPLVTSQEAAPEIMKSLVAPRAPETIQPGGTITFGPTGTTISGPTPAGQTPPQGSISVEPRGPDVGSISDIERTKKASQEAAEFTNKDITNDIATGTKSLNMLRTVALMREYGNLLDNETPIGQLSATFVNRVKEELGVTLDPSQSARNAFDQVANTLIGEMRTDDGIQRVAGPELNFFGRALPNSFQDRKSLNANLDSLEIKARNLIKVGRLAGDTYGSTGGNITPQAYSEYVKQRNAILAPPTLDQPITTPAPPLPSQTPPPPPDNSGRVIIKDRNGRVVNQ